MPLIHSKKPKAFKANIRAEVHAGKPVKQAVAIAYSVKRKAEKHKMADGGELKAMPKPKLMAEGGSVYSGKQRFDNERGVFHPKHDRPGDSYVGDMAREKDHGAAKFFHNAKLAQMKEMPKPHGEYAEGGEVEAKAEPDHELEDMAGEELMSAFDSKDKKRVRESLEAMILHAMNKE